MRARLAWTIVALAARTLGTRHADWAQAMKAELDVAIDDGRPMSFAAGCLLASWRQMLRFPEGRLTLVSHLLAIGLIVPLAALWLWLGLLGYPYLAIGNVGVWGFIEGRSEQIPRLLVGEWSLAPAPFFINVSDRCVLPGSCSNGIGQGFHPLRDSTPQP